MEFKYFNNQNLAFYKLNNYKNKSNIINIFLKKRNYKKIEEKKSKFKKK